MSVKYTVTNYHFYEPKELTESQYLGIKQKLQNDPDYSIMDKNETITNEFNFKNLVRVSFIDTLCFLENTMVNQFNQLLSFGTWSCPGYLISKT